MALFPSTTTIGVANPLKITMRFKTLKTSFDELGKQNRKRKWLYPKRDIVLSYEWITKAEALTLWQFYQARYGSYESFNIFIEYSDSYVGEYVGTGDGSTTIFNLPSKNASAYTLYKDGIVQSGSGVDYTFGSLGGADGADKVTFIVAPAAGERITFTFTGNLKIHTHFKEDSLTFEAFYDRLMKMGITLEGDLNE
jgi:hypothetical protein